MKYLVTLWIINCITEEAVKVIIKKAELLYDMLPGLKEVGDIHITVPLGQKEYS